MNIRNQLPKNTKFIHLSNLNDFWFNTFDEDLTKRLDFRANTPLGELAKGKVMDPRCTESTKQEYLPSTLDEIKQTYAQEYAFLAQVGDGSPDEC